MNQTMQRIEELRKNKKLKKYELCDAINLRQNTYSTWLKRDTSPDTECVIKFADYFNVSTDYILRGIDVGSEIYGESQATLLRIFNNLNDSEKEMVIKFAGFIENEKNIHI